MMNNAIATHASLAGSGQYKTINSPMNFMGLPGPGGLQQYTQGYQSVIPDELIENQKWIYVRKSSLHGKKQGETVGIILVDVDGKQKRLTMEELAVLAGWEW